ncbi:MAG: MBL fold metallo-hydrolase [Bacteroidota bacterium]
MRNVYLPFRLQIFLGSVILLTLGTGMAWSLERSEKPLVQTLDIGSNSIHIVTQPQGYLMVDAGIEGQEEKIEKALAKIDIEPTQITHLLLTHGHVDHAGTATYFQQTYGIKVIAGRGDEQLLKAGVADTLCPTNGMAKILTGFFGDITFAPVVADIWIEEETDLAKWGLNGRVVPYPGHTEGSIVFFLADRAFVGDIIRGAPLAAKKPRLHFYLCDLDKNRENIATILQDTSIHTWYPGHFGPLSVASVRMWWQKQYGKSDS